MKKVLAFLCITAMLLVFCPVARAEDGPTRGPVMTFSVTILHRWLRTGGIQKPTNKTWNQGISVTVDTLSVPSGTTFRITLVNSSGNVIGEYEDWIATGTKTLNLFSNKTGETMIRLEQRNLWEVGNIQNTGSFTGSYY